MRRRRPLFMMLVCLLLTALAAPVHAAGANADRGGKPGQPTRDPQPPAFTEVSVHDPSIVRHGGTYYVFGSHIEAAKSTDLMNWTRFTNGYTTPGNTLYGDLSANLAGSFAWAGENDADSLGGFAVWAPDVFWNEHFVNEDGTKGAWLIYYSASSTYIRSAIGFAASKHIEGPYTYVDTIVYSGFTRDEAYDANSRVNKKWTNTNLSALVENGVLDGPNPDWFNANGSYNNTLYPNAIDANVFYDKDGRLWMTYGSWSGGIFILELDKQTGRPIYPGEDGTTPDGRMIDRYFGTKIAGGYTKSGEGPYIVYDRETDYYYLYMSYGWLGSDGGYNIRVFRSRRPDGPYVDTLGQNAVLPGNVDHTPYGIKLMGNFLFERRIGEPGEGIGYGYVSPGHNSVYYDKETGKRFLVFHARFPGKGEIHEVRVHQLFLNKKGWPVAAPYRYAGEKLEKVNRQDLIGEYRFINHGKAYSEAIERSGYIRLNPNNTISGDVQGSWKKTGHFDAELTIDGKTYYGVFVKQWDPVSEAWVMTFTAISDEGVAIWGSKLEDRTEAQIVQDIAADLALGDTSGVTGNLNLPTEGTRRARIAWTTSDPGVVTETGVVTRPPAGAEPVSAVLTATITYGPERAVKTFPITVLPRRPATLAAHYAFEGNLDDATESFASGTPIGDRIDSVGGTIGYAEGKIGRAAVFDGASGVRLPNGLIQGDAYSVSVWLKPEQLTMYTTTFFGARNPDNWVSLVPRGPAGGQTMVWSGSAWYDGAAGLTIPTGEWSHLAFTVDGGELVVYVNGEERFRGANFPHVFTVPDAVFALGVNWWDPPYQGLMDELRIYEGALQPYEVAALAGAGG